MVLEPVSSIVALSLSIVKATSFLLSFIQRYSPFKELLVWLEHTINKIVDRDTKSNVINIFIYILFISIFILKKHYISKTVIF